MFQNTGTIYLGDYRAGNNTGTVNYISNIYGFKAVNYVYHSGHRASILLKRYKETHDGYIINAV